MYFLLICILSTVFVGIFYIIDKIATLLEKYKNR